MYGLLVGEYFGGREGNAVHVSVVFSVCTCAMNFCFQVRSYTFWPCLFPFGGVLHLLRRACSHVYRKPLEGIGYSISKMRLVRVVKERSFANLTFIWNEPLGEA